MQIINPVAQAALDTLILSRIQAEKSQRLLSEAR